MTDAAELSPEARRRIVYALIQQIRDCGVGFQGPFSERERIAETVNDIYALACEAKLVADGGSLSSRHDVKNLKRRWRLRRFLGLADD